MVAATARSEGDRPGLRSVAAVAVLLVIGGFSLASSAYPQPVEEAITITPGGPVLIGYWLVVAGPTASVGIDSRRGIEIAIEDKGGKLIDHPIVLTGENAGCSASGGLAAARKLAANKQIVAAVGPSCSSEAVTGVQILWDARIVTVSPSNTAPHLTDPLRPAVYNWYLRTSFNDKLQGVVAAEFARGVLQVNKAATIHDGSPYALAILATFTRTYIGLGGTITAQVSVSPSDRDMRAVLAKIATDRPELIYYPTFVAAGSQIARQAKETTGLENVKLMGADGMFSADFLRAAGGAAVGMYLTSPDFSPETLGSAYEQFLAKYQQKYGKPISSFHGHAYDATMMIFAALEKVAQKDAAGNTLIGRKHLRDALYATQDFKGVTGVLTCDPFGDCADAKIGVYQIVSADPGSWDPGTNPKKVHLQSIKP